MKQIEVQLRGGMAPTASRPTPMEQIILSITSFALYGFRIARGEFRATGVCERLPEGPLPSAFYAALLNNQPMGFYHPLYAGEGCATAGFAFSRSMCGCRIGTAVEPDGAMRMGLRYVSDLRSEVGKAIAAWGRQLRANSRPPRSNADLICPKCGCDDGSMLEPVEGRGARRRHLLLQ